MLTATESLREAYLTALSTQASPRVEMPAEEYQSYYVPPNQLKLDGSLKQDLAVSTGSDDRLTEAKI
jgi:hypothetical protein